MRAWLLVSSVAALVALSGCGQRGAANVILISIDTLRADHLHCYGYPRETSPNLDRIAAEGARFETVIAESSWTLPTHASILTGLTSNVHQAQLDGVRIDPARTTLAEVFAQAGYVTKGIYSAPYLHPIFGFGQGFQDYESVVDGIVYDDPAFHFDTRDPQLARRLVETHLASHRTVSSKIVVERAIEFLRARREAPFFLFLHLFDPHSDYRPPEEYWRRFDPDYQGTMTGENFWGNSDVHPGMDPRDRAHVVALYDGEILFTDAHLGRLLRALDELKLTDDTLIVVTSDHGEEFFEHGATTHRRTLFDEVLKVPLLFRFPGRIPAGQVFRAQVRQIDLMPTILSLIDLPVPGEVMGEGFDAALSGRGAIGDRPAVARLIKPKWSSIWNAIRTPEGKFHSIVTNDAQDGAQRRELFFDLARDPGERAPHRSAAAHPGWLAAREQLEEFTERELRIRDALPTSPDNRVELPAPMLRMLRELGYLE